MTQGSVVEFELATVDARLTTRCEPLPWSAGEVMRAHVKALAVALMKGYQKKKTHHRLKRASSAVGHRVSLIFLHLSDVSLVL